MSVVGGRTDMVGNRRHFQSLTPFGHRTRRLAPIHDLLKRLDPMAVAILLLVAGFRMGARVLINEMWY